MNKDIVESTIDNDFETFQANDALAFSDALMQVKRAAFADFTTLNFPSTKNEEWRFTPILAISKGALSVLPVAISANAALKLNAAGKEELGNKIIFINGHYSASKSNIVDEKGIKISKVIDSIESQEGKFNTLSDNHSEPFSALNTAFFNDGICIEILKNASIEHPIIIENIFTSTANKHFIQQRNMIIAEAGTKASIVFEYTVQANATAYMNILSECFVAENAHIELLHDIQPNHPLHLINNTFAAQKKDSTFTCHSIATDGTLIRNNLSVRLEEKNAICYLNGLYIATDNHLIDNHLAVHHLVPNCQSHQLYKGVLKDKSTGVFNGKIFVHKDAQKTNAYQSNKNLVLSDTAVMHTKPQLEIFADDVKCSHGATVGQLDENAKFYLMARGISQEHATALLTYAFASEVTEKISNTEIKKRLNTQLQTKLGYSFEAL